MSKTIKELPPLTEAEQQEREAEYFAMCVLIPEEQLRAEVERLKIAGVPFGLDKIDAMLKLAQLFKCSIPRIMVRMFQVYPEIRRKFMLHD